MTVVELIEALRGLPGDLLVWTYDEGTPHEVKGAEEVMLYHHLSRWTTDPDDAFLCAWWKENGEPPAGAFPVAMIK